MKRLLLLFLITGLAGADDWTQWRGPTRDGVSKEKDWKPEALKGRPKILWSAQIGAGHSSMIVTGKHVFTLGNFGGQDVVTCLDVETGKPVWRLPYKCAPGGFPGPRSSPVLDDGLIYTLSRDGLALCVDSTNGRVKWRSNLRKLYKARNIDYGFTGSPLVLDKAVIYNACDSGIALDKKTGEKIWASKADAHGYATPVPCTYKKKKAVAIFSATKLFLKEVETGEDLDSIPWRTDFDANAADPLFFDDRMFLTSGWERGCALFDITKDPPRQLWQKKTMRGQIASPIHVDGHIYGIDDNTPNGKLTCIEVEKGKTKWTEKGGFENLMVAGGRILAITNRGVLVVAEANPEAYKELARVTIFRKRGKYWTAPLLANGRLYCRSSKGDLVCIDVR